MDTGFSARRHGFDPRTQCECDTCLWEWCDSSERRASSLPIRPGDEARLLTENERGSSPRVGAMRRESDGLDARLQPSITRFDSGPTLHLVVVVQRRGLHVANVRMRVRFPSTTPCGCSSVVEPLSSKQATPVRFWSAAPSKETPMKYACQCVRLTRAQARDSGLRTIAEFRREFGACKQCGSCAPVLATVLREGAALVKQ